MTDDYNPATRPCSGHAMFGATSLQHAIFGHWPHATDVGVYICRPTADGDPSVHGNGRAGDIGPGDDPCAAVAAWLVANHTTLGVQLVIWQHHIWNVSRASEGWRPYGCDKPGSKKDHHTGHVHWEINNDAAARLTPGIVASTFPPPPAPTPPPQEDDRMFILNPVTDAPDTTQYFVNGAEYVPLTADEAQQFRNSGFQTRDMEPLAFHIFKRTAQEISRP